MSERFIARAEKPDEKLETLKNRLSEILDFKLDVDLLDRADEYLAELLDEIVDIVDAIRAIYAEKYHEIQDPHIQEDEALKELGFGNVPQVLNKISEVQDVLAYMIPNIIASQVPEVITPPDKTITISPGSGSGYNENREIVARLKMLLFILINDCNADSQSIDVKRGIVTDAMIRKEPYVSVHIPDINRLVIVCDEYGNRTDIFDTTCDKYNELGREGIELLSKEQKNDFGRTNPGAQAGLVYGNDWSERLYSLLVNKIPQDVEMENISRRPKTFEVLPRVGEDGFFIDELGEEWGASAAIGNRLTGRGGLHQDDKFRQLLSTIESKKVSKPPATLSAYKLSEVRQLVMNDTELSAFLRKANEDGEWVDENGNKWATLSSNLITLMGSDWLAQADDLKFKEGLSDLTAVKVLSGTRKMKAYRQEDIKRLLLEHPAFLLRDKKINDQGFYIDSEREMWGSKFKIAEHITGAGGFYKNKQFSDLLDKLSTQKIKGGISSINSYKLSEVISAMKAHPELSRWLRQADPGTHIFTDDEGKKWCSPTVISFELTGNDFLTRKPGFKALFDSKKALSIFVNGHAVDAYDLQYITEQVEGNPDLQKYTKSKN